MMREYGRTALNDSFSLLLLDLCFLKVLHLQSQDEHERFVELIGRFAYHISQTFQFHNRLCIHNCYDYGGCGYQLQFFVLWRSQSSHPCYISQEAKNHWVETGKICNHTAFFEEVSQVRIQLNRFTTTKKTDAEKLLSGRVIGNE